MRRFLKWLCLAEGDRIVRIKSLRPSLYRNPWGRWELSWPCLLVDRLGGSRATVWPVWDRARVLGLFGLHRPPAQPKPEISTATFGGPTSNW